MSTSSTAPTSSSTAYPPYPIVEDTPTDSPFSWLPAELILKIFFDLNLSFRELPNIKLVCKCWNEIASNSSLLMRGIYYREVAFSSGKWAQLGLDVSGEDPEEEICSLPLEQFLADRKNARVLFPSDPDPLLLIRIPKGVSLSWLGKLIDSHVPGVRGDFYKELRDYVEGTTEGPVEREATGAPPPVGLPPARPVPAMLPPSMMHPMPLPYSTPPATLPPVMPDPMPASLNDLFSRLYEPSPPGEGGGKHDKELASMRAALLNKTTEVGSWVILMRHLPPGGIESLPTERLLGYQDPSILLTTACFLAEYFTYRHLTHPDKADGRTRETVGEEKIIKTVEGIFKELQKLSNPEKGVRSYSYGLILACAAARIFKGKYMPLLLQTADDPNDAWVRGVFNDEP